MLSQELYLQLTVMIGIDFAYWQSAQLLLFLNSESFL